MGHGADGLDVRTVLHLSQAVGGADTAAQNRRVSAVVARALALCAAGAELHDAAGRMGVQAGDAGSLRGDEAVEVHGLEQVGLDQDRTDQITFDADHLHMGVTDGALRQSIHVALPLVGAQILAEFLAHALGAQPADVLLVEVIVQQKAGQLALAGADGITLIVRVLAEEHIEHQRRILEAMQEQAVGHRELVKIHDHCGVIIIFIRNIRNNFDLVHDGFPLFCPVMTGCLYHDSIFPVRVQVVL